MRLPWSAALACSIGLSALVLTPAPAHACSQIATCQSPLRVFPTTANIPGNLVFFRVLTQQPFTATLRAINGTPIPADVRMIGGDRVFAPLADLPAGLDVQLQYDEVCPSGVPAPTPGLPQPNRQRTFTFRTGPAADLEPSTPSLSYAGRDIEGDFATTLVEVSAPKAATAHLTDILVTVGGDKGGTAQAMHVSDEGMIALPISCSEPNLVASNSCTGITRFGAADYIVEARFSVVGAGEQPGSTKLPVTLACDDGCALSSNRRAGDNAITFVLLGLALLGRRRSRV